MSFWSRSVKKDPKNPRRRGGFSLIELLVVMALVFLLMYSAYDYLQETLETYREYKRVAEAAALLSAAETYFHLYGTVPTINDLKDRDLISDSFDPTGVVLQLNIGPGQWPGQDPCLWRIGTVMVSVSDPSFRGRIFNLDYDPAAHRYTLRRHFKLPESRLDFLPKALGVCRFNWFPY